MLTLNRFVPYALPIPYDPAIDGKVFGDVDEVVFSLQQVPADGDSDFLLKRMSLSEITFDAPTATWTVIIDQADFTGIPADTYVPVFGIKYTGDTQFRQIPLVNKQDLSTILTIKVLETWLEITS